MVLSSRVRALGAVLVALLLSACLKPPQTVKLAQPAGVISAYVLTYADRPDVAPVPKELADEIESALGGRNLQPRALEARAFAEPFARKRSTADRLAVLAAKAEAAGEPFVMLVETTPRYYSLLSGRYRWNIDLKVTIASTANLDGAQSENYDLAAFLDFDHQDEEDALRYQASPIADRVGRVADQFLTGLDDSAVERPTRAQVGASEENEPESGPLAPGAAIYFLMVDRFHNGEPSNDGDADPLDPHGFHGGDLQGVAEKLGWIEDLGATTVWLSPIFEMRTEKFHGHGAFHGYWVEDLAQVEDRFGGERALKQVVDAADARGMNLMFDLVVNHVGMDTKLTREHPDWFHQKGGITDWDDPEQIVTHDVHGLPDLAVEKPEVYQYLARTALRWVAAYDPAGFRLDAVKHVPTSFWTQFNADIEKRAGDDFVMLGEDLDGDPARVAKTMREGNFDAMFDFPLHFAMVDVFCRDAHPGRLASVLFADRLYPDEVGARRQGLVTLLDNHDLPRILSACGNDVERVVDAATFMLSARGTPSITWGTESGALGAKEPDNRADMQFVEHPLGSAIRTWLGRRKSAPVFTHGTDTLLRLGEDHFTYLRSTPTQSAVIAFNRGGPRPVAVPGPSGVTWTNVATNVSSTTLQAGPGVTVWTTPQAVRVAREGVAAISFDLDGAPTPDVRVVGSGPELGNWNPFDAPVLGDVDLPVGSAFAYKFVAIGEEGAMFWESGDNRYLLVDGAATTRATFRR